MTLLNPEILQAGDTLLYRPVSFAIRTPRTWVGWAFGRAIALKTWHSLSHCEVYMGRGMSYASRDGLGVDCYPLRLTELAYVLRPVPGVGERLNLDAGIFWFFRYARGQKYDWWGLTRFVRTSITPSSTRMFCSAFWLRFYRACGFNPFNARIDADSIAPGQILDSPKLQQVWPVPASTEEQI